MEDLKKDYQVLAKKYKLPSFMELNENFEIDKIEKGAGCLLRSVRKVMMEKVINTLGFVEMLLNPMNAPRMYLLYMKAMSADDRKGIDKIYNELSILSLDALELEVDYSEKGESNLIKKILKTWDGIKPEFREIIKNMKRPNNFVGKKERSYFG